MAIGGSFDKWDLGSAVATVVAAVAAASCAQFIKTPDSSISIGWMSGQIVAVMLAAAAPTATAVRAKRREAHAAREELSARTQTRLEMNEALDPIVRCLGADHGGDANRLRSEVLWLVVKTAVQIIGPQNGVRSCYFELEEGPPKRLVATEYHAGRPGSNRSTFVAGTADGDAAISMVEQRDGADRHRLCGDVNANPPPGWGRKTRDYSTFISVAVTAGGAAYGMLTVDAVEAGSLTRRDVDLLGVMAGLIAIAMRRDGTGDVVGPS